MQTCKKMDSFHANSIKINQKSARFCPLQGLSTAIHTIITGGFW